MVPLDCDWQSQGISTNLMLVRKESQNLYFNKIPCDKYAYF